MKKYLFVLVFVLGLAGVVSAQVESSVIKNTTNGTVFAIKYGSGAATVEVAGVVSATTLSGAIPTINNTGTASINSLAVTGEFELASTSLSVTTGQIIALGNVPVIKVTAAGVADLTVTATVAAVSSARVGNTYYIVNTGASNGVLITDSAPVYNSGATLGPTDASTYFVSETNVIVQLNTGNN